MAGFSSFLVVGLAALVDPDAIPASGPAELGIVGDPDGTLGARLAPSNFRILRYPDEAAGLEAFRTGRIDALVVIDSRGDEGDPVALRLVLPDGDLRATFTLVQLKAQLEQMERDLRTEREGRLRSEPVYVEGTGGGGSFAFVYALLVPLLVFLPVVLSGALAADSITEEVQRGTLPLLLASPASPSDVVEGKLFANVALTPLLSIAWMALLAMNGIAIPLAGAAWIALLATAGAVLLGVLACAIALITRDRNKAHLTYASALILVLELSVVLPASPVNAVARLAVGSAGPAAYATVTLACAAALASWAALRWWLRPGAQRLL